jgi:iron(II)-dependent oxidoreductase
MNRESLLTEIDRTDRRMITLLRELSDEQLEVPYGTGINPPVWELGHTAFFYEFFLLRRLYRVDAIMPGFDAVWDSFEIPHRERWEPGVVPPKEATLSYYRRVMDESRDRLAAGNQLSEEELYLGEYVLAHQCMHLESLIWCRQTLGYPAPPWSREFAPKESAAGFESSPDAEIPGGTYSIGMPSKQTGSQLVPFSFDNERPGFDLALAPFSISRTLVSQREFLEFVEDSGYENRDLWSVGGSYWIRKNPRNHPVYWEKQDGQWTVRRFDRIAPLSTDAPVIHVSFWEAEAYARWAGRRLPTEFEWEAAARTFEARPYPWGDGLAPCPADLDANHLATAPVSAYPEGSTPHGCLQMIGTAWEWTTSQYLPYDGFCADMYAYMSTLQFGTHKTTRGGSFATSSSLIRNTYRQAQHPDRCDTFTGFRTCPTEK